MITIESSRHVIRGREAPFTLGEDQLAAVAFLARYSGRTLEAYRHDLRALFQWAADHHLPVLEATRTHLELYRASMEDRGLAASTIDRRLSTACGFYRFAHIDGRISSNPAQYVRRPTVPPSEARGLDRGDLARRGLNWAGGATRTVARVSLDHVLCLVHQARQGASRGTFGIPSARLTPRVLGYPECVESCTSVLCPF